MVEATRCRFMAARVSAGAENRMLAKKRTAVAMQGIGSDGATKTGLLPSMRNPSTCRVLRRAWTVGRLAGSLRFSPWPRIVRRHQDCQSDNRLSQANHLTKEINSI